MHAKTSEEIIHATRYLQAKPDVAVDPNVLLRFPAPPLPSCSKSQVCHTPPRVLLENSSVQEYEREKIEESSIKTYQKVQMTKSYQLILISLFINKTSIFFNFP